MSSTIIRNWGGLFASAALLAFLSLDARAQFVNDINGLREATYLFFCCESDLTITDNYPVLAKFDEQFTTAAAGADFANRHEFQFSSNGGSTARIFNNDDSFDVSVDVMLEAGTNIPRKEAGLRTNRSFQDGRFIVTTNEGALETGEIVAFGGPFPFFSFDDEFGIRYTPGTTISLRMIYNAPTGPGCLETPGNCGTMQYFVDYLGNSYDSGVIPFSNTEGGIVNGNVVAAYLQATPSASNPTDDFGIATFTNFEFGTGEVGIDGDYNDDGTVDAADYVIWRKFEGTMNELPNDPDGGTIGELQYATWRENFGEPSSGGGGGSAVPEPATLALAFFASLGVLGLARRRQ